jgi:MFS family permease
VGLAGFSITATFAPAIGPAIGGYLNDTYRWPWVFYVNLVPGAVMFAALWHGLPKADARLLVGAGLLVFGASCFMNLDLDLDYAASAAVLARRHEGARPGGHFDPPVGDRDGRDCAGGTAH